ncbi:MAG: DUF1858 domain-containing protein [bacterium]
MSRPPLTGDILVEDLVDHYPELIGPLAHRGVVCMVCGEAYWGTLEELARSKGIADIRGLVKDLRMDLAQGPV